MPQRRPQSDDGPSQDWMVTFSDCMTLLLTFFVMLLAFSSFDPEFLGAIGGAIEEPSNPSIFRARQPRDNPVPPPPAPEERSTEGSEKPTFERLDAITQPRPPLQITSRDAYRDRRVLVIPSDRLFWGWGSRLKRDGRLLLGPIAEYLKLVSSHVVITETSGRIARPNAASAARRATDRTLAVLEHLTRAERLEAARFSISTSAPPVPDEDPDGPVVTIAILNPEIYP